LPWYVADESVPRAAATGDIYLQMPSSFVIGERHLEFIGTPHGAYPKPEVHFKQ
jgi:hypothetical protein